MKLFNNVCGTEDHGNETVPPHSTYGVNIVRSILLLVIDTRTPDFCGYNKFLYKDERLAVQL